MQSKSMRLGSCSLGWCWFVEVFLKYSNSKTAHAPTLGFCGGMDLGFQIKRNIETQKCILLWCWCSEGVGRCFSGCHFYSVVDVLASCKTFLQGKYVDRNFGEVKFQSYSLKRNKRNTHQLRFGRSPRYSFALILFPIWFHVIVGVWHTIRFYILNLYFFPTFGTLFWVA